MKNEIRVRIDGLNLSRIINYLIDNKIVLNNVIIKNKFIVFSINSKDILWLDKICKFEHKTYRVLHRYGIVNFISQIPRYLGVFLALIVVSCYLISFSFTIFEVNVCNDSKIDYDLSKVNYILSSKGVVVGSGKFRYSAKEIEEILMNSLKDISGCSVEYDGSVLNVKIYPSVEKYENNQSGLYSKYDAVINSIDIFSGESDCRVGQIVKCGDLLIKSENGASGEIKGKVYFSSSKLYNKRQEKIVYTGKYEVIRNVFIFNKNISKTQKQCGFLNYLTKKCDFYLVENYFLPIRVEEIYCFEYNLIEEIVEFENVEEQIKQELYNETLSKIPVEAEIGQTSFSIVVEGDYTRIDCFIETCIDLV